MASGTPSLQKLDINISKSHFEKQHCSSLSTMPNSPSSSPKSLYEFKLNHMTRWITESDKTRLLGRLMVIEAVLCLLWILAVLVTKTYVKPFVDYFVVWILLILTVAFIPIIYTLYRQAVTLKSNTRRLRVLQCQMLFIYNLYMISLLWSIGASEFVIGVSLAGGTVTSLMLIERKLVWWAFFGQALVLIVLMLTNNLAYFSSQHMASAKVLPTLPPNLLQAYFANSEPLNSTYMQNVFAFRHHLFWQITYLYFGLFKAVMFTAVASKLLDMGHAKKALIRYKAEYDELTGLRNRRSLFKVVWQKLCANRYHDDQSMLLIDLDDFKQVNDKHGHLVGDTVLKAAASIFRSALPHSAEISRYGGEEFIVLLYNTPQKQAIDTANRLKKTLAASKIFIGDEQFLTITASFGVATVDKACVALIQKRCQQIINSKEPKSILKHELMDTFVIIIKHADGALYLAKQGGKNKVAACDILTLQNMQDLLPVGIASQRN